jgi:hypothetical protein
MSEEMSKLACFYVGFNGVFRGVSRCLLPFVENSVRRYRPCYFYYLDVPSIFRRSL